MPTRFLRTEDPSLSRRAYERSRDLPRLLPLWPNEQAALTSDCPRTRRLLVARLQAALRAERRRGRSGHWSYDLNRHRALSQAYSAEAAANPGGGRGSRATQIPRL